jgi:YidC/Oxa1 family membrane protein insertase
MQEIQEKYKDDPQRLSEETMKLLKKEWSAPLKGCLSMLIQLPIFIGLYFVIRAFATWAIATEHTDWLYSFFWSFWNKYLDPQNVNSMFLWIDLFEKNSLVLTIAVACLNFIQFRLTSLTQKGQKAPQQNIWWVAMHDMSKMMWTMNIMMTIMMASVVWSIQSWVWLYLATTSLFSIVQYLIQYRVLLKAKWNMLFNKNKPIVVETK